MKTYIVQLEAHDDFLTVRDKISWSKANRVLLVWPRRGQVLERRVDLLLLQRHARQLGAQLAAVTRSEVVKAQARSLGMPVFSNAEEAQSDPWRRGRRRRRLPWAGRKLADPKTIREQYDALVRRPAENRALRLAAFTVGVLAFLVLALSFAPGAEIELKPAQTRQQMTIAVWANPSIHTPNASGGLPARELSVVVEGRDEAPSTSQARIADQPASGEVTLSNLTDQPVEVPAGSVVLTLSNPPARFKTLEIVRVLAGPGKTARAVIQAVDPGSDGNVAAGSIRAMEGPVGLRLSVTNAAATSGGADRPSPAPSESDYQKLEDKLLATLKNSALAELQGQVKTGQRLLAASLRKNKVVEAAREPAAGQPADRLQLSMRVEYVAWVISQSDLDVVAQAALDANRAKGYQVAPGSLKVTFASEPVMEPLAAGASGDAASARWKLDVTRNLEAAWSKASLVSAVQGRRVDEALRILQASLPLAEAPRIRLYPAWWGILPFLPFRISVVAL